MVNIIDLAQNIGLFKQFKINDLLFVEYKCLEERSVFEVWSHCNYFVYVLSGKKKWQTKQSEYMVHEGEAIFVQKGASIIHKFFEVQFCAIMIFIPDDFIKNVFQNNANKLPDTSAPRDTVFPIQLDEILNAYFQSIFTYLLKSEPPSNTLLDLKFKELILNVICSPENQALCHYFKSLCNSSKSSIRDLMETNFSYSLDLKEFARLSGRSLTSFKRDFQKTYSTSPGRWLTKKRLEFSHHLLQTTDKSISQIAFESGFENFSHYCKAFKNQYGRSPLQFRKTAAIA